MYYMIGASVPSLHRESTDSLISKGAHILCTIIHTAISQFNANHYCCVNRPPIIVECFPSLIRADLNTSRISVTIDQSELAIRTGSCACIRKNGHMAF